MTHLIVKIRHKCALFLGAPK